MKTSLPLLALLACATLSAYAANPGYEDGDETTTTNAEPERPAIQDHSAGQINTLSRPLGGRRGGAGTGGDTTGGSGSGGGAAGGGGGALPKELQGTQWEIVPGGIRAMREHAGAHGVMRIPGPKHGVSVAFMTNLEIPAGEFRNGRCAASETPRAKADDACMVYMWISAKPGGGPLGKSCFQGPLFPRVATAEWFVGGKGFKGNMQGSCPLKPGKAYWCNFTATGFERGAKQCDMGLASPISDMDGQMDKVVPK